MEKGLCHRQSVLHFHRMTEHIVTIGGATWDVLFTTPQAELIEPRSSRQKLLAFPYGGKLDAREITYGFGGGAANVAVGLSRLGFRTGIVTRVGNDWRGSEVVKNLKSNKVDVREVQVDRRSTTALSFIVTTGGPRDHVAFVARGASESLGIGSIGAGYAWAYVTSLAMPAWSIQLTRLFKRLSSRETRIFWNPGAAQLAKPQVVRRLLRYVDILDLNRAEAEYLVRDLRLKDGGVRGLMQALHKAGAARILVTDGAAGAYFFDGTTVTKQAVFRITPTNTTGAGDSFGAGFLAGYIASLGNAKTALLWGMTNASSVIMSSGAQRGLLTRAEMMRRVAMR